MFNIELWVVMFGLWCFILMVGEYVILVNKQDLLGFIIVLSSYIPILIWYFINKYK
jgi:hypothetical protein